MVLSVLRRSDHVTFVRVQLLMMGRGRGIVIDSWALLIVESRRNLLQCMRSRKSTPASGDEHMNSSTLVIISCHLDPADTMSSFIPLTCGDTSLCVPLLALVKHLRGVSSLWWRSCSFHSKTLHMITEVMCTIQILILQDHYTVFSQKQSPEVILKSSKYRNHINEWPKHFIICFITVTSQWEQTAAGI